MQFEKALVLDASFGQGHVLEVSNMHFEKALVLDASYRQGHG